MNENELETLCRAVEAGEDDIEARLGALESRCLVDKRGRTVFDVAIESHNLVAVEYLCKDRQALMFATPANNALRDPVRHSAAMQGIEYPITEIEQYLADSFGPDLGYNRTPLLTACRLGNGPAMERLLRAGAKVADRDLLGLTAPELAFYSGGEEGLERFIGACRAAGTKPFSLGRQMLRDLLPLEGAAGLIRVVVSNPYGRIGDAALALRPLDEDGSPTDGWTELLCTGESLDIDGEAVDPHTLDEPVYGETPWEARYELPLARDTQVNQLQIRIACDQDQTLNSVLDAWSPKEKA